MVLKSHILKAITINFIKTKCALADIITLGFKAISALETHDVHIMSLESHECDGIATSIVIPSVYRMSQMQELSQSHKYIYITCIYIYIYIYIYI